MSQAEPDILFKCPICEKGFRRKDYMQKRHMLIHTNSRPFECSVCPRKFRTNQGLRNHQAVHTKERQFQCCFCEKKYSFRTSLIKHERTHEDNRPRPHVCCYCSRGFLQKQHLIAHLVAHNNIRMYQCKKCGKAFNRNSHLEKHYLCWHRQTVTQDTDKILTENQTDGECNAGNSTSIFNPVDVEPDSGVTFGSLLAKSSQNGEVSTQFQDVLLSTGATGPDFWTEEIPQQHVENLESHHQIPNGLEDWTGSYNESGLEALLETWISSDVTEIPRLNTPTVENWTRDDNDESLDWGQNIIPSVNKMHPISEEQVESHNTSLHPQHKNVTEQSNYLEQEQSFNSNSKDETSSEKLVSSCSVTINSPMWCNESVIKSFAIQPSQGTIQSRTLPNSIAAAQPSDFNFFPHDLQMIETYGSNVFPPEEEMLLLLI